MFHAWFCLQFMQVHLVQFHNSIWQIAFIMLQPPFHLALSVLWCWSYEKEWRAVEVVPDI